MKRKSTVATKGGDPFRKMLDQINKGVHRDWEQAKDQLAKNELQSYIYDVDGKADGLNIEAMEANDELTLENVVDIALHFAFTHVHDSLHRVIEKGAGDVGIEVVTDLNQLPPEVLKAMKDALHNVFGDEIDDDPNDSPKPKRTRKFK